MTNDTQGVGERWLVWHKEEAVSYYNNSRTSDGWDVREISLDGKEDSFVAFCVTEVRAERIIADHNEAHTLAGLAQRCEHSRQWVIPNTIAGNGAWCFNCGAIRLTGEWMLPDALTAGPEAAAE